MKTYDTRVSFHSDGSVPGVMRPEMIPDRVPGSEPERVFPSDFPPGSPGATPPVPPPRTFLEALDRLSVPHTVTWQPVTRRHVIWRRVGVEWKPLFTCENPFDRKWAHIEPGDPIPLDNRVLAFLHDSDPANYGGFREMAMQVKRQREREELAKKNRQLDWIGELRHSAEQNTKIRIGYGRSPGDRFSRQTNLEVSKEGHHVPL